MIGACKYAFVVCYLLNITDIGGYIYVYILRTHSFGTVAIVLLAAVFPLCFNCVTLIKLHASYDFFFFFFFFLPPTLCVAAGTTATSSSTARATSCT